MKTLILIPALLLATPAWAGNVYKCAQGQQVSYQSTPCAAGVASRIWAAPPDPPAAPVEPQIQRPQPVRETRERRQQSPRTGRPAARGARIGMAGDQNACDRARASQKAAYERLGLRRTFAQSRHWDQRVASACR